MRKNILKVAVTGTILTLALGLTGCGENKSAEDMIVDGIISAEKAEDAVNASKIVKKPVDEKDIKISIHGVTFPLTVGMSELENIAKDAGWSMSGILEVKVKTEDGTFTIDTMDGKEGEEVFVIQKLDFGTVPTDCVKITGVDMDYVCKLLADWENVEADLNEYVELTESINSIKLIREKYKDR